MEKEQVIDAIALESAKLFIADQIAQFNTPGLDAYSVHKREFTVFGGQRTDPDIIAIKMLEAYNYTRDKLVRITAEEELKSNPFK